jgi:hypothetical protein
MFKSAKKKKINHWFVEEKKEMNGLDLTGPSCDRRGSNLVKYKRNKKIAYRFYKSHYWSYICVFEILDLFIVVHILYNWTYTLLIMVTNHMQQHSIKWWVTNQQNMNE